MGVCARIAELLKRAAAPTQPTRALEVPKLRLPKISEPVTISADQWEELNTARMGMHQLFAGGDANNQNGSFLRRLFPKEDISGPFFMLRGVSSVTPKLNEDDTFTFQGSDVSAFKALGEWMERVVQPQMFLLREQGVQLPFFDQRLDKLVAFTQAVNSAFGHVHVEYPAAAEPRPAGR